jgi:hypothetical protein
MVRVMGFRGRWTSHCMRVCSAPDGRAGTTEVRASSPVRIARPYEAVSSFPRRARRTSIPALEGPARSLIRDVDRTISAAWARAFLDPRGDRFVAPVRSRGNRCPNRPEPWLDRGAGPRVGV